MMIWKIKFVLFLFSCSSTFTLGYYKQHSTATALDSQLTVDASVLFEKEQELRENIHRNYNKHVLPHHNNTHPVRVALEMTVIAIRELDDKVEMLTLDAWLKMEWTDNRLQWEQDKFGGLDKISMQRHAIWFPDIQLLNRLKLSSEVHSEADVLCSVQHDGKVTWIQPSTFHSHCIVDLKFFPFDRQTCNLTFGSWTYDGFSIEMDLVENPEKVSFKNKSYQNNQWEVLESNSYKNIKFLPCCEAPNSDATFEINLRRRSPYYKYTTLYPTLSVAALTLIAFWLPPDALDKIVLGGVSFLSLILLLIHLSWKTPPAGKTVPMIVAFCGNLIMIVTTSIILSVISIVWGRARYNSRPPRWMRNVLQSLLGRFLCINSPIVILHSNHVDDVVSIDLDGNTEPISDNTKQNYFASEWMQCFNLIDRINFIIFVGVITSTLAGAFAMNQ